MTDIAIQKSEIHRTSYVGTMGGKALADLLEAAVRSKVGISSDQTGVTVAVSIQAMPDGSTGASIKIVVDHAVDAADESKEESVKPVIEAAAGQAATTGATAAEEVPLGQGAVSALATAPTAPAAAAAPVAPGFVPGFSVALKAA